MKTIVPDAIRYVHAAGVKPPGNLDGINFLPRSGFSTVLRHNYTAQYSGSLSLSSQWVALTTLSGTSNLAPVTVTSTKLANHLLMVFS